MALIVSVLALEFTLVLSICFNELRAVLPWSLTDGDVQLPPQLVGLSLLNLGLMWSLRKEFKVCAMCGFVHLI